MLGIIVQLLLSWAILRFLERKPLSVLGLQPGQKQVRYFLLFLGLAVVIASSDYFLKMAIAQQRWVLSPRLSWTTVLQGIWWNVKSVLFEELLFRGALFYILLRRLGAGAAITLSSVAFGVYHWFSFGVLGQP